MDIAMRTMIGVEQKPPASVQFAQTNSVGSSVDLELYNKARFRVRPGRSQPQQSAQSVERCEDRE